MTQGSDGLQVSGSAQVTAGAIAVGDGAHAQGANIHLEITSPPGNLDELRAALDAVVAQLRACPPGLDDAAGLADVATSAQREARKSEPSRRVLAGLLDALIAGVAKIAPIAEAVAAIQHSVSVLL